MMVWFVVAAFTVFLLGLVIVTYDIAKLGHKDTTHKTQST